MSVSRISAPMNSRAFGRHSACCAKIGSRRFAALTSRAFVFAPACSSSTRSYAMPAP